MSSPPDKELKDTVKTVNTKIKRIHDALIVYYNINSTLTPPFPKPASLTATGGTGYLTSLTACSGLATNGCVSNGNIWVGGVPTRTLNLPDDYAFDEWGNRLTYAVDTAGGTGITLNYTSGTAVPVTDITGAVAPSGQVSAVIISHGKDGAGSYSKAGAQNAKTCSSVSTFPEYQNCNFGAGTTFYSDNRQVDGSGIITYDDFTNYVALTNPGIYVVSRYSTTNVAQKFTTSGSFITSFGKNYGPNGEFASNGTSNAMGIAIDSSGNRWIVDYTNTSTLSGVVKYDSAGKFLLHSQAGIFGSLPGTIAISASGSIAVPDPGGCGGWNCIRFLDNNGNYLYNIGETHYFNSGAALFGITFDPSGNHLWLSSLTYPQYFPYNGDYFGEFSIPAPNTDTTNLYSSTEWQGSPIHYNYLTGLALNSSGNSLWMTDYLNNRLMNCNASGSCTQIVPPSGTAAGATTTTFNGPIDVVLDNASPNQNIWVSDTFNNRVQKFDFNGNWLLTIGGGGVCISGSCTLNPYPTKCTSSSPSSANLTIGCYSDHPCDPPPGSTSGSLGPGASYYFNQPYGIAYGK